MSMFSTRVALAGKMVVEDVVSQSDACDRRGLGLIASTSDGTPLFLFARIPS